MAQVPQPPTLPFLGNVRDIDPNTPVLSFQKLAQEYGECFRVEIGGHSVVVVNSYELLNEICDDKRFTKRPSGSLLEVRNGVGDALFTAFGEEENWGIAHRILMPKLGPLAIQAMFDG